VSHHTQDLCRGEMLFYDGVGKLAPTKCASYVSNQLFCLGVFFCLGQQAVPVNLGSENELI